MHVQVYVCTRMCVFVCLCVCVCVCVRVRVWRLMLREVFQLAIITISIFKRLSFFCNPVPCFGESALQGGGRYGHSRSEMVLAVVFSIVISLVVGILLGYGCNWMLQRRQQNGEWGPVPTKDNDRLTNPGEQRNQNPYYFDTPVKNANLVVGERGGTSSFGQGGGVPPRNIYINELKSNNAKMPNGYAEASVQKHNTIYL